MNIVMTRGAVSVFLLLVFPAVAAAEVMDKELFLAQIWTWCLLGVLLGFALCRLRAWLIFVVLPIMLVLPIAAIVELQDPYVGPAILEEAGYNYVIQIYVASLVTIAGPVAGVVFRLRQRRQEKSVPIQACSSPP